MSNDLKVLPQVTVGTTAVQITPSAMQAQNWHKWASVSIQAALTNGGTVYIGAWLPAVTTTQYSRALSAGDVFIIAGSAIDVNRIGAIASASGQLINVSGS
jgi:hypothetical protein